jgi:RHS repeat-associated protein
VVATVATLLAASLPAAVLLVVADAVLAPEPANALVNVASIAPSTFSSCDITSSGRIQCWGQGQSGQLGDGTWTTHFYPTFVSGIASGASVVSVGQEFACGVVSSAASCWGRGSFGSLGNGSTQYKNVPTGVTGLSSGVSALSAGSYHACAVVSGAAKCWGDNTDGVLGDGTTTRRLAPVQVSGLTTGVTAISLGVNFSCAVVSGGVKCWGNGTYGALGNGGTTASSTPVQVTGLTANVTALGPSSSDSVSMCAIQSGAVKCWGGNFWGQLGDGTTTNALTPVGVSGLSSGVSKIVIGQTSGCVLMSDASVKCWGYGGIGGLGTGGTFDSPTPITVSALGNSTVALGVASNVGCAVDTSGTARCWGSNSNGNLGDGTTTNRLSPTGVLGTYVQVAPTGGGVSLAEAPCGASTVGRQIAGTQSQCGDPVNSATGNFHETFTDLSTPGRGIPLNVSRTFNAMLANADGPFGWGWTVPYFGTLTQTPTLATIGLPGGGSVMFNRSGSVYAPTAPRIDATLVDNGNGTLTYTEHGMNFFDFDAVTGHLLSQSDLNGHLASSPYATTFGYTGSQLTTVTDPAGRAYTFHWTGSHVTSVTDSSTPQRTVTYTYNGAGELTDAVDVGGGHTTFTYDASHRMLTRRAPKYFGDTTTTPTPVLTNVYDAQGRVTSQTDEIGRQTTFDYTSIPGSTKITDPKGNVTLQTYSSGLLVAETRGYGTPQAATTSYWYDPNTLGRTAIQDPNGVFTVYTYDASGNRSSATDALGRTTSWTYNAFNEVTSIVEPLKFGSTSLVTTLQYDEPGMSAGGAGNLTSKSTPLLNDSGVTLATQTITYNHLDAAHPGDLTSQVDAEGNATSFTYDSFGNNTSVTAPPTAENPSGNTILYGFDTAKGWKVSEVLPRGVSAGVSSSCTPPALGCATFAHDAFGRVTTTTDRLGHTNSDHYDANGNWDSSTDGDGNVTQYTYDPANQLVSTHRADTTSLQNEYWGDGSLKAQVDGLGARTTYTYDPVGRVETITDPALRVTTLSYDAAGHRTGKADNGGSCTPPITAASKCTTTTYDALGELVGISYSDGVTPNVSYTYDVLGRRLTMGDQTGTSRWAYDSLGRMTSSTSGTNKAIGYGYDLRGLTTSIVYPGTTGTVLQHRDAAGRIDSITDWNGNQTSFGYNRDSSLISQTNPNGTTVARTVDDANNVQSISDAPTANPNAPLLSFAYGRDNAGQLSSVTATGVPTENSSYTYTPLNQLKTTTAGTFTYDAADNSVRLANGTTQTFDAANQLCWTLPSSSANTCSAPPAGATTYSYDSRGDRTAKTNSSTITSTAFDQANRLTSATTSPKVIAVADGASHSLALKSDGTVWSWGLNTNGQLGNNSTVQSLVPVQVSGLTNVTAISAGASHSLALKSDGTVWSWGLNTNGQLGNNSTVQSLVPVQVSGLTSVTAISAGTAHSVARKSNSTVWAWGLNSSGQLGDTTTTQRLVPVQTSGLTTATGVAAGGSHSLAVLADGTARAWGLNSSGELGNNTTTNSSTPVTVSGLGTVTSIAAGSAHSVARKTNGTVWAWGLNSSGQLGNNTTTNAKVPVQTSGITTATSVGAGANHSLLVKTDGTVWAWGLNANGQLGNNATVNAKVPVQAGTATNVLAATGGASHTTSVRADGQVWSWGLNTNGQVGDNTTTQRKVPVQTVNLPGATTTASYTYNGDGIRTSKTVNGTATAQVYTLVGEVPRLLQDGATNYIYDPFGKPLEQVSASGTFWYQTDQIGSIRGLTDNLGAVVATYTYDPYGNLTGSTGSIANPLRFAGEYTDAETGFQYLRARYYDPASAQFLSRDPALSTTRDAYGYAQRSPLNNTDPSGMKTPGLKSSPTPTLRKPGWDTGCWFPTATGWYQYDPDNTVEYTGGDKRKHLISPPSSANIAPANYYPTLEQEQAASRPRQSSSESADESEPGLWGVALHCGEGAITVYEVLESTGFGAVLGLFGSGIAILIGCVGVAGVSAAGEGG